MKKHDNIKSLVNAELRFFNNMSNHGKQNEPKEVKEIKEPKKYVKKEAP